MSSELPARWPLVAASFLGIAFSVGILAPAYSIGALVQPLSQSFGWSRGEVQAAPLALTASVIPMTFVIGWLADRFGPKRLIIASQIGFCLCYVALGLFLRDLTTFYALYFLIGIMASGTLPITFLKVLSNAFTAQRGLAIGIALAGSGLTGFMVPAYTTALASTYGWREAFFGLAALPLLAAIPAALLLPADRRNVSTAPDALAPTEGFEFAEAIRTTRYWVMGFAFFFAAAAATGLLTSIVPLLVDDGYAPATAAEMVGFVGIFVVLGRLSVGYLVDRFWAPAVAIFFLTPAAVGAWILADGTLGPMLSVVAICMIGLATGAEFDLAAYLCSRYFGRRRFGAIYAGHYALFALGGAVASMLFGIAYDRLGSYDVAVLAGGGAFVVCGLMLLGLGRYPDFGSNDARH